MVTIVQRWTVFDATGRGDIRSEKFVEIEILHDCNSLTVDNKRKKGLPITDNPFMHTALVSSGSLPSVALCFPNASKIEQSNELCNIFVNTASQQCFTTTQAEIRR